MPSYNSTKYPNNIRVVSGAVTLYNDDVVLLCDTSVAPVSMTLLDIPANYWSTQWRLHIVDNASNASTNNITINAGFGQTIDGQASITINTDGGSAILTILANTQFTATFGGGGGGGGYNLIKDEGVPLPQRQIINFTGAYVTAFDNGIDTTNVEVKPFIQNISNANLLTLINTNGVIDGLFYRVTDPLFGIDVVVLGTSSNKVSTHGTSRWWVADYQGVGNYSGVVGFNSQLGRWWIGATPAVGDVVIWNNLHWVNITGANGANPPSSDFVNWNALAPSDKRGYLIETMDVLYDVTINRTMVVKDKRYNEVHFANPKFQVTFLNFPFGDNNVLRNLIKGANSLIEGFCNVHVSLVRGNTIDNSDLVCTDLINPTKKTWSILDNYLRGGSQMGIYEGYCPVAEFWGNTLNAGLLLFKNPLVTFSGDIFAKYNNVNGGQLTLGLPLGNVNGTDNIFVEGNQILNSGGAINIPVAQSSIAPIYIQRNLIQGASIWTMDIDSANLQNCVATTDIPITLVQLNNNAEQGGINSVLTATESTWKKKLDMSLGSVYDVLTQTLNLGTEQHVGLYLIKNVGTGNITNITGGYVASPDREFQLITLDIGGAPMVLTPTLIGVAVADNIIANSGLNGVFSFQGYATYSDRVTLYRGGGAGGFNFIKLSQTAQ